ncbi:PP2C family protein-serine/threonine phosphatase [Actinoplanes sp. NPDC026623]|uniref:PP2C family protein-serine/threonine phosphatase n=1 Tax=Actinoplanes sp. NPDC026623 TaxID=3155610 RepID=UPI003404A6D8
MSDSTPDDLASPAHDRRAWPWREAIVDLLARTRLAHPDELAAAINAAVAPLGIDITVYLIDHEQRLLHPVPEPGKDVGGPLPVDATLAGRAFMATAALTAPAGQEEAPLWMPLVDGVERLGILRIDSAGSAVSDSAEFESQCDMLAALLGHLVAIKMEYGPHLARTRRTRRMSVASELLWRLLPPLTFADHRFTVSAILEPCYTAGGDGYDYAVDDGTAFMVICDTTGHGLRAGIGTAVALSAMRTARTDREGLYMTARAVDAAFTEQFTDARFATAVLMELDLPTGRLRYVNAGHHPPIILRDGKPAGRLDAGRRLPLGIDDAELTVGEVMLQPGDRILAYTDGVTEARDTHGELFGEERLLDLAARHTLAGQSAPETLRRLSHAVLAHLDGPPPDDATLLLAEWSTDTAAELLP